ncbi:MAG: XDD4 family exosortase-dependent surface protein [Phycisphaerae bacterium]
MKSFWAAGLLCLATTAAAHASIITDLGTVGGRDVAGSADFDMSAGKVTITLQNLTAQTADASQLLTGLAFTLRNGATTVSTAGFMATGSERTVFGDGSYADSGVNHLSWELITGNTMQIDFHPDAADALIGPATGGTDLSAGVYTANGSILGNAGHNPFAAETATFTLTNPELLSTTSVSNVTFLWGTSLSQNVPLAGAIVPVPEASSIGLLGCGALMLLRRKRRR